MVERGYDSSRMCEFEKHVYLWAKLMFKDYCKLFEERDNALITVS